MLSRLKRAPLQRLVTTLPRNLATEAELVAQGKERICRGIGRMSDLVLDRGLGAEVWTVDGNRYLDMTCGIGVTNTGHCHPKVVAAAQAQMAKLVHGQVNIVFHQPMIELCERLKNKVMPFGLDTFFFWNSGAEAVEAAVKLARHATNKQGVLVFQGGYHGRTMGTMAMTTSKYIYRAGFGPLMPGVFVAPFPYTAQWKRWMAPKGSPEPSIEDAEDACLAHSLEQLKLVLAQQAAPRDLACIVVEPIQGEGGYVPPPKGFLRALRQLCDDHGILLVADEVQTGFGRTGKWFAMEHDDVAPDILIFAKGVASGLPLSGIASTKAIMDAQPPGSMGGTYGGNAVACAAANATIDAMLEENMLHNAVERGAQLMEGLQKIRQKHEQASSSLGVFRDIRGRGLMVGVEFDAENYPGIAQKVSAACLQRGMLLLTTSVFETVRIIPPLNVTAAEIDECLAIFSGALGDALAVPPTKRPGFCSRPQ